MMFLAAALTFALALLAPSPSPPVAHSFPLAAPRPARGPPVVRPRLIGGRGRAASPLHYANSNADIPSSPPPLPDTDDPYLILNISDSDLLTSGIKAIKRAYRKMALVYHPDAVVTPGSTETERRRANENFARINAAYDTLRKGGGGSAAGAGASGGSWTVPRQRRWHRDSSYEAPPDSQKKGKNWGGPWPWSSPNNAGGQEWRFDSLSAAQRLKEEVERIGSEIEARTAHEAARVNEARRAAGASTHARAASTDGARAVASYLDFLSQAKRLKLEVERILWEIEARQAAKTRKEEAQIRWENEVLAAEDAATAREEEERRVRREIEARAAANAAAERLRETEERVRWEIEARNAEEVTRARQEEARVRWEEEARAAQEAAKAREAEEERTRQEIEARAAARIRWEEEARIQWEEEG